MFLSICLNLRKKKLNFLVNLVFIFGHTITRFEFDWFRIAASNACVSLHFCLCLWWLKYAGLLLNMSGQKSYYKKKKTKTHKHTQHTKSKSIRIKQFTSLFTQQITKLKQIKNTQLVITQQTGQPNK